MAQRIVRVDVAQPQEVLTAMETLREKLRIPTGYPAEAIADIRHVDISIFPDRREIPFVTIDPPGASDLDQAMHLAREGDGYLVRYAISAVGLFVEPGGALDQEVHARGVTLYGPDGSIPLHPTELSAGAASLLEGQDRPAYLWYLHLDAGGGLRHSWVEYAQVRSRAQLTYEQVQEAHDTGSRLADDVPEDLTELLAEIGQKRIEREIARGGVSLDLPEQLIEKAENGYRLAYRGTTDADEWNAQISLLTGMAAARLMSKAGIGILRTLPPAREEDYQRLRQVALALGLEWSADVDYPTFVRSLDSDNASHAAFLNEATGLFRGASYLPLGVDDDAENNSGTKSKNGAAGQNGAEGKAEADRADKKRIEKNAEHSAIASLYAHVTAPLRRLIDRYALEACRCICAGEEIPDWVREALPGLPKTMARANQRASAYERGAINALEGLILSGYEGEIFHAVVIEVSDGEEPRGSIMLREPAVEAYIYGNNLPVGTDVRVRLVRVTPEGPEFELVKGKHAR